MWFIHDTNIKIKFYKNKNNSLGDCFTKKREHHTQLAVYPHALCYNGSMFYLVNISFVVS